MDLDGVLCHGLGRYETREPDLEQIARVRRLVALGWDVIIWTSRAATFEGKRRTEAWLRRHEVDHLRLVMGKPTFDAMVDDRALPEIPEDVDEFAARAFSPSRFRTDANEGASS